MNRRTKRKTQAARRRAVYTFADEAAMARAKAEAAERMLRLDPRIPEQRAALALLDECGEGHLRAFALHMEGKSRGSVAAATGLSPGAVARIIRIYRESGVCGDPKNRRIIKNREKYL